MSTRQSLKSRARNAGVNKKDIVVLSAVAAANIGVQLAAEQANMADTKIMGIAKPADLLAIGEVGAGVALTLSGNDKMARAGLISFSAGLAPFSLFMFNTARDALFKPAAASASTSQSLRRQAAFRQQFAQSSMQQQEMPTIRQTWTQGGGGYGQQRVTSYQGIAQNYGGSSGGSSYPMFT